ncbi:hypothetical protein C2S51_016452 [Perilla frutescens var. frutescens]|nr:hypothetical protein C2S51_016452 [Perilla frutescens var. frutescens]
MAKPFISNPFIFLLLLILLLLAATTPPSYSDNQTDFEALLAFKKAIHHDPLGALSSWNETTHFCRWNGVSCSRRHPNRVVSVSLQSQGLVGSLSPHIAVEYLHCGTDSTVIHGDLKPSNILLDQDMVAHVGDFGLAKIISSISQNLDGSSSVAIKGTIGYIAPEYGMNNLVSTEGDAYSYGVLLLEMFTNTRPTSDAFEGHINLQDFVSGALTDRIMKVVDPFLHQEISMGENCGVCIESVLSIGVKCSKELPRERMTMTQVVNELRKIRNVFLADRHASN